MDDSRPIAETECLADVLPQYLHANHLTILTGPPYVGKSRFLLWLSYCAAMGHPCFYGLRDPMRVLFCTERSRELVMTQMKGLGLALPPEERFKLFTLSDMSRNTYRTFREDPLDHVSKLVDKLKPNFTILDTLVHFLPPNKGEPGKGGVNDYGGMADKIMQIQIWSNSHGMASLAAHHTAKEKEGAIYVNILDKSLGSQAIQGNTTSTWNLSPVMDSPLEDGTLFLRMHAETHAHIRPPDVYIRVQRNLPLEICTQEDVPILTPLPEPKGELQDAILKEISAAKEESKRADIVKNVCLSTGAERTNVQKAVAKLIDRKMLAERIDFSTHTRWLTKLIS